MKYIIVICKSKTESSANCRKIN